ncbi:MAG: hypothetical protein JSW06_01665 [Thermoplasmatales archaeon]|nr:MAG: hypothetical protein JSW06_01665 [Thermoplasmatales archaeon]
MKELRKNSILKLKIFLLVSVLTLTASTPMAINTPTEIIREDNGIISSAYNNENELIITFKTPEVTKTQITTDNGIFSLFTASDGFIGELGKPQIPMWTQLFAVPSTQISIEILNANIVDSYHVERVYPAQQPQLDHGPIETSEFFFDESFYKQDLEYPGQIVEIKNSGKIRDIPFVKIGFYPIQYNPKQEIVTIYDELTLKLSSTNNDQLLVESKFTQKPFYRYYENVFTNWDGFFEHTNIEQKSISNTGTRETGCDYLIITYPTYNSEIIELANWKHIKGLMTKVVSVIDIGSTAVQIRQYIQNAYDTWDIIPSYVLLIGDAEQIPTNYVYSAASDLWYVTVDGSDYYPDMFIGRIPADTSDEANTIVQKILNYEKNPPTQSSFYNDFAVAAYFQDDEQNGYETRRFVRTSEEVRDYLLSEGYDGERIYVTESYINPTHYNNGYYGNGEPLPPELLRPTFAWDGDKTDIINAIESGIFILNHRDHGGVSGWGDPDFTISDFSSFSNGELLPVVFSLNCLTGRFDDSECFCEEFLRKDDGGVVAAYGASRTSYSGYNDYLCRGFYDAQWPDFDQDIGGNIPLYSLGEILNYGKTYMANTWGDPWGYERLTFEMFHVFGDPSMEIWSAFPKVLTVDHLPLLQYGPSIYEVTVKSNGNPVEGALVCVYQPNGVYASGLTDSSGVADLELDVEEPDEAILTVTAHNHQYYQSNIQIGSSYPPYPPTVDGPANGKPEKEYEYTSVTTDPEDDQILYLFDWGDGTQSEWLGPYNSGEPVTASHAWPAVGDYEINVRAKDIEGSISYWSDPFLLHIDLPALIVGVIKGGLKVSVPIINTGNAEADDINWKITVDGGFILLGKETTGTIPTIPLGEEEIVRSSLIFGFGQTTVTVTADIPEDSDNRNQGAFLLLFYINVHPSGG